MHPLRSRRAATTSLRGVLAVFLYLAGCTIGSASGMNGVAGDGGCTGFLCQSDRDCPTLTCSCNQTKVGDGGGGTLMQTINGSCAEGCCATCPPTCN